MSASVRLQLSACCVFFGVRVRVRVVCVLCVCRVCECLCHARKLWGASEATTGTLVGRSVGEKGEGKGLNLDKTLRRHRDVEHDLERIKRTKK